jgi:hypothetical protein
MDKKVFNNNKEIRLEYKGYTAVCTPNPKDRNRLYGMPCAPGHPNKPMKDWPFAGDTAKDAEKQFRYQVNAIIRREEYRAEQKAWSEVNDKESIGSVFDILPEKFLDRISTGQFDKNLLEGVQGGDYVVPLYYVTKAWDILLKGTLDGWSFMIGPEEDDDFSDESLKEFMEEEGATRSRGQATIDNDQMKVLWKEQFGIDIDKIEVDFTQYNKHIPPRISKSAYYDYFLDVPDGVVEWIMGGINHPTGGVTFECVSCLMEFTALIELVRQGKFCGFCK